MPHDHHLRPLFQKLRRQQLHLNRPARQQEMFPGFRVDPEMVGIYPDCLYQRHPNLH
jgi:hypothetical protein